MAVALASSAAEAKADDVVILDLRRLSYSFDFFVLASATSARRIDSISDRIRQELDARASRSCHREGRGDSGWVLLDYGPVVAHIFSPEARDFYRLERLWADAPHLAWKPKRLKAT